MSEYRLISSEEYMQLSGSQYQEYQEYQAQQALTLLNVNESRLKEIEEKYKNLTISDHRSYEGMKEIRTELVTMRTSLDRRRKEISKPYREKIEEINSEAKRLNVWLKRIEDPLQATIRQWEQQKEQEKLKKEQEEKARIHVLKDMINRLNELPFMHINASQDDIQNAIVEAESFNCESMQEFELEAIQTKDNVLMKLNNLMAVAKKVAALEKERAAERAAEREREEERKKIQKEQEAIADRITKHEKQLAEKQAAIAYFGKISTLHKGKSAHELRYLLSVLNGLEPKKDELASSYDDVMDAYIVAVESTKAAISAQEKKAEQEREQEKKKEHEQENIQFRVEYDDKTIAMSHAGKIIKLISCIGMSQISIKSVQNAIQLAYALGIEDGKSKMEKRHDRKN